MKRLSVAAYGVLAVGLLVVGSAWVAGAGDPHLGIWKQNFEKSKIDPPPTGPRPQSVTRTYEVFEGNGLKLTIETVSPDGQHSTQTTSTHFDQKDYPWTGSAAVDAISEKPIDASTFDFTLKKAGKTVTTGRNTVSKDGKTMTVTTKGTNAQGQPTSAVAIFEKQ
jgi:hypothetical protein